MPPPTMHLNSLARLVTCLVLPITLLVTLGRVDTFNVETSNARLLTVPSGSASQFGVSLNFLPETSKEKNPDQIVLLVGAPNQKETVNIDNVEESALGVVYLCKDVLSPQYDCSSFRLDDKKRIEKATLNEHFGSAVAILENGDYVICSPQWLDTEKEIYNYTFIPGRCSVKFSDQKSADKSMEIQPYYHKAFTWKRYFIELEGRTIYRHGTSNYGVSVDAKKGNLFVAGVPGVLEGKGTVDVRDLSSGRSYALRVEAIIDEQSIYGYLGFEPTYIWFQIRRLTTSAN
ncbi:hypothetical protein PoB_000696700 [Plakobranchus ocellatus]|uniref:Uncharacterized protein n=1 Tax=Plakobranchus ocellatus TaxID=259542 RepID=A0AAV3YC36_9GAST|nr:hypothetical protein PoB_000696700 [Plakobranchus ocellatus]